MIPSEIVCDENVIRTETTIPVLMQTTICNLRHRPQKTKYGVEVQVHLLLLTTIMTTNINKVGAKKKILIRMMRMIIMGMNMNITRMERVIVLITDLLSFEVLRRECKTPINIKVLGKNSTRTQS